MFELRRITTDPATHLKILVDHAQGDGDGGFTGGGSFHFAPAGQDGDRHTMNGHAARVIMGDPGLAVHFECSPPLPGSESAKAAPARPAATTKPEAPAAPPAASRPKPRRRGRNADSQATDGD